MKLIDLFREWDDDGNGALDKHELLQAVAALGYDARSMLLMRSSIRSMRIGVVGLSFTSSRRQ